MIRNQGKKNAWILLFVIPPPPPSPSPCERSWFVFFATLSPSSFPLWSVDNQKKNKKCGSYSELNEALESQLADYNDANPVMNLVLFEVAMEHIVKKKTLLVFPLPHENFFLFWFCGVQSPPQKKKLGFGEDSK